MDDCVGSLRKADGTLQKPVAYLTCNFNRRWATSRRCSP